MNGFVSMGRRKRREYPVVCFQVIYLLAEDDTPEVFADKFYDVEVVCEAWPVSGESR